MKAVDPVEHKAEAFDRPHSAGDGHDMANEAG